MAGHGWRSTSSQRTQLGKANELPAEDLDPAHLLPEGGLPDDHDEPRPAFMQHDLLTGTRSQHGHVFAIAASQVTTRARNSRFSLARSRSRG
jgi:hypothetical protein